VTARPIRCAAAALAALLLTTACSGSSASDRAGGDAGHAVTTLRLANVNGSTPRQLQDYADQVRQLSKGSLKIDFVNNIHPGRSDAERTTIGDVRAGTYDMGWVGARVWDQMGVTAFQALLAPMLVDSYGLESKVFEENIPDQMLKRVQDAGVVGVAVLPGPMRKVLGVNKPLLKPNDFTGLRFGTADSNESDQTVRALGATPVTLPPGAKLDGLDGMDQQLESIDGNHYDVAAAATTANLDLWPRPLVIFTSSGTWAKLSAGQRQDLTKAGDQAQLPALNASRQEDQLAMSGLCKTRMTLPQATPQQLTSLRAAVEPIYTALRSQPSTNGWLGRIQVLKEQLNLPPEGATCAGLPEDAQPASTIDGTYQKLSLKADLLKACGGVIPPDQASAAASNVAQVVFDHGTVTQYELDPGQPKQIGWAGTYRLFRDTLELSENGTTAHFTVTWSLKGTTLRLSNMQNGHCDDVAAWSLRPWTKVK
jgi:TRAP-type C4-dicarboxylate transport system substrate-binding protein